MPKNNGEKKVLKTNLNGIRISKAIEARMEMTEVDESGEVSEFIVWLCFEMGGYLWMFFSKWKHLFCED